MEWIIVIPLVVLGYLSGSLPFSFLVGKLRGVDLRTVGSGNTGASNVWRTCGFKWFVLALSLDVLKGFVPTALAYRVLHVDPLVTVLVGLAAMLGHVYPAFLHFKGGKAVATTGGVMFAIHPALLVVSAVVWTVIYKLSGYPSVASLLGIVIIAIISTAMAMTGRLFPAFSVFVWISLVIVFYLHRANIDRLMHGTENRIGRKAK
ncbi:MAG TPA: glycerol-3-phosphate 1-O-acyltransferase PlsY [Herpetosiphonaceae bacterium]|nr:glycerol-3-phosphate 1-O-acyltransferase PlsY [Herpetosiphonaceae bacterium]